MYLPNVMPMDAATIRPKAASADSGNSPDVGSCKPATYAVWKIQHPTPTNAVKINRCRMPNCMLSMLDYSAMKSNYFSIFPHRFDFPAPFSHNTG